MVFDAPSAVNRERGWRREAERMVEDQLRARDVRDERVLDAMKRVPRHRFVETARRDLAYDDCPLPIGYNQTISQPYIVGIMTELLRPTSSDRILEIGTGCGYQASVLGTLVEEVHTVEIVEPLAARARTALGELGFANVHVHVADGNEGWPEAAPYDGILLAAAPVRLPPALASQLRPGRFLVAPVGPLKEQVLMTYQKATDGSLQPRRLFDVRFVPLVETPSEPF